MMLRKSLALMLASAVTGIILCYPQPAQAYCPQTSDATPRGPIALNEQGEFVPDWAKSAVWYQVFPERFRDGDPSNNPTVRDIAGADPAEPPKVWQIHPWGSDWYKRQPYEVANGEPELWRHLLRRRYGGDLQGVIDKLDYIQHMGFNAIYLNPVFTAPSLHKYDAASFHHIDPNFGPDPAGDRALIATENPLDPSTWVWTKADELALELITRGHRLVADDAPEFTQIAPDVLDGTCPDMLQDLLEVRGLGVLNIRQMFGDTAVKKNKYLRLIVHLTKPMTDPLPSGLERLTGDNSTRRILDLDVPMTTLPVMPGRNLAVLTEAATRLHSLRMKGLDPAAAFIARHSNFLERGEA